MRSTQKHLRIVLINNKNPKTKYKWLWKFHVPGNYYIILIRLLYDFKWNLNVKKLKNR